MTELPLKILVERIYKSGKSLCFVIPRAWIDNAQRKQGKKLTGVRIVTYDDHLELVPYFGPKKRGRGKSAKLQYINREDLSVPTSHDAGGNPDVH